VTRFLLVCAGGAFGSGARYLVVLWASRVLGTAAPWGTLLVNLSGSFALAFLMEMAMRPAGLSPEVRLLVGTGILGGFTTYSAFNLETTLFLRSGAWVAALANMLATVAGCLLTGALGHILARWIFGRS
jgi:fluoride exporter